MLSTASKTAEIAVHESQIKKPFVLNEGLQYDAGANVAKQMKGDAGINKILAFASIQIRL